MQQIENRPFTDRDIQNYNHPWRMFTTTAQKENDSFQEASITERATAINRLANYGVHEIPADVERALERLKLARYLCWQFTTRATQKAPGAYVVGPSNYNSRRHERVWRGESKHYDAIDRAKRLLSRALNRYSPSAAISSDDEDAVDKLEAKINAAEKAQEQMKAANKVCQNKKLTDEEKAYKLGSMDFTPEAIHEILRPRFSYEHQGFQSWKLTNNSSNIRRMKERVEELKRKRSDVEKEATAENGIRVVDNVSENRLQIFFPGKPDKEVIEKLKRAGFRWTPSIGAWQRHRSCNANYQAEQITGVKI